MVGFHSLNSILESFKSLNRKSWCSNYCRSSRHAKRPSREDHEHKASNFKTINIPSNVTFTVPQPHPRITISWHTFLCCLTSESSCNCQLINANQADVSKRKQGGCCCFPHTRHNRPLKKKYQKFRAKCTANYGNALYTRLCPLSIYNVTLKRERKSERRVA